MAEYTVTITLTVGINARSQQEAAERAERLGEEACKGVYATPARWRPGWVDMETETEKED